MNPKYGKPTWYLLLNADLLERGEGATARNPGSSKVMEEVLSEGDGRWEVSGDFILNAGGPIVDGTFGSGFGTAS